MDGRREELVRLEEEARVATHRGGTLIALVPPVGIVAIVLEPSLGITPVIAATVYGFVGGLVGLFMCGYGLADQRRCRRELAALAELHQLPEARVIRG